MKYKNCMRILVLVCLIFSYGALSAQKAKIDMWGYPFYNDVMEHAIKYLPQLTAADEKYELAKKSEGWVWQLVVYNGNDWIARDSKLCWSAATKKYIAGSQANGDEVADLVKSNFFKYTGDQFNFEHECYYGYRGWTDDVIHLLGDSAHLGDAKLEALARAYASEAGNRLSPTGSFDVIERRVGDAEGMTSMPPAQVDSFLKYQHLAIQTYARLKKQNPKYETMIGGVNCKYGNECMQAYLAPAWHQNGKEAAKELKDSLYDEFMIAFAKNLLNSCGRNGILITDGDNDTYPLYYVQARYGYRRDVLIVNAALLDLNRYISYLQRGVFDAPPLPLGLTYADYAGDKLDYVRKTEPKYNELVAATGLDFDPDADILYKEDIMLLSMIAANNWQRPVYASFSINQALLLKMAKYFVTDGLAYRLTKNKTTAMAIYYAPMNTEFGFPFFMKQIEPVNWKKQPYITEEVRRITINYQGFYDKVAKELEDENRCDDCVALMNKYTELFPESKIPYSVFVVDMPGLYARCGHLPEAKAMADKLTKTANAAYAAHINNAANEDLQEWIRSMQEALYILQELEPFVKENYTDVTFKRNYESAFNEKKLQYGNKLQELSGGK